MQGLKWKSRLPYLEILAASVGYLAVVSAIYVRFGTLPQLALPVVALLTIPAASYAMKSKELLRSSILFVLVILTYEALQGVTGVLATTGNAISLEGLDRAILGTNLNADVQVTFGSSLTTLVSTIFYGMHVFLIMIAICLFWVKDKLVYRRYVYSMVLTSYIALLTFVLVPSSPPWFVGAAKNLLAQGDSMLPSAFQAIQGILLAGESDVFAAFPSLHAAYATLFCYFMFKIGRRYGLASLPVTFGIYFSTIYLGQHYLVDIIAGAGCALCSALLVERLVPRKEESAGGPLGGAPVDSRTS